MYVCIHIHIMYTISCTKYHICIYYMNTFKAFILVNHEYKKKMQNILQIFDKKKLKQFLERIHSDQTE